MLRYRHIISLVAAFTLCLTVPVHAGNGGQMPWTACVGTVSTFVATPSLDGTPSVFNYQIVSVATGYIWDISTHRDTLEIYWNAGEFPAGKYLVGVQEVYDVPGAELCPGSLTYDTMTLVNTRPVILDPANKYRLCNGNTLAIAYNAGDFNYYKLSADSAWKAVDGFAVNLSEAGEYRLYAAADTNGVCIGDTAFTVFPSIKALLGSDTLICTAEFLLMLRQWKDNPNGTVYTWYHSSDDDPFGKVIKSGSEVDLYVAEHETEINNVYWVTADFEDCEVGDTVVVKRCESLPELVVPNTITPNGDGENDVWNISGLDKYEKAAVEVFDRWGRRVYMAKAGGRPWDGRDMHGRQLPVEAYYYVIHLNDDRHKHPLTGVVHIIK